MSSHLDINRGAGNGRKDFKMKLTSKQGMTVVISDTEYSELLSKHGPQAKEKILTWAGRVFKHRQVIDRFQKQKLTEEEQKNVSQLAMAMIRSHLIDCELRDMGYGEYLRRRDLGGLMPESWSRTVSQAADRVGNIDIEPDAFDIQNAMAELGYYTEKDLEWAERITCRTDWEIAVPEDWGKSKRWDGEKMVVCD